MSTTAVSRTGGTTAAPRTDRDSAYRWGRQLELNAHPSPPRGATMYAGRVSHQVASGDTFTSVAQRYSNAFHLFLDAGDIQKANPGVNPRTLQVGSRLNVPQVNERFDAFVDSYSPRLHQVGNRLRHDVGRGETLSSIASRYRSAAGLQIGAQDIFAANMDRLVNPNRVRAGADLLVPGVSTKGPSNRLDSGVIATRVGAIRLENGTRKAQSIMQFRMDSDRATKTASYNDAVRAASQLVRSGKVRSGQAAVVQTRDGAWWAAPVNGREASGLGDGYKVLAHTVRRDTTRVKAWVEKTDAGVKTTRF